VPDPTTVSSPTTDSGTSLVPGETYGEKDHGTPLYRGIRDYLLKFIEPQWEIIKETRRITPYANTPEGEKEAKKFAILGLGAAGVIGTAAAFSHNGGKKKGGK